MGPGRKSASFSADAHRTRARSAAAVRGGEGLVQVEVHHVDAQVAGADDAQQGIQVGAVAIDQPAAIVDDLDDLLEVFVEQTERVRIGQHQSDRRYRRRQLSGQPGPRCRARRMGSARPPGCSWPKRPGWCRAPNRG